MSVIDGSLLAALALLFVPVTVLLMEVLGALRPIRPVSLPDIVRPRVAVLVPAHNESKGIVGTLNSLLPQLGEGERLLVIADNCSDDTAQVALEGGAEVVERNDCSRRGKGYALDYGISYLSADSALKNPDVVVIVDADCVVTPGAIDRIARLSAAAGRPVQATYLMKAPKSAGATGLIAEFAWIVKNKVRPLGSHNLGLPCHLMGSGMALPWAALKSAQFVGGHIVEDLKMGLDFAHARIPALYCPDALVWSYIAVNEEGAATQRMRWEHGHLAVIFAEGPRLFFDGIRAARPDLLVLALDLCVPPLALLMLVFTALSGLCAMNALIYASLVPLLVSGILVTMFAFAMGLCWWRFGREAVPVRGLIHLPLYVMQKIPLYLRFFFQRQKQWVKSKRDAK